MHNLMNNFKTAMLLGGLMGLFLIVGAQYGTGGMIIALIFGGLTNIFAWFYSDTIAIKAMRARRIAPPEEGVEGALWGHTPDVATTRIYNSTERLAARAGLPMPKVYLCPHDAPNAFATGRSPRKAAVAVTRGLAFSMNDEELDGVIAHELAHIKHRDTLISTIAATIAGVLAFLAQGAFFLGIGRREGQNPFMASLVVSVAAVGAAVIKAMISRSREFAADAEGARIAGTTAGLASALGKLDAVSRRVPLKQPNPAQNNLFIVEPFNGKMLTGMFATHPPVEKRIRALMTLGI